MYGLTASRLATFNACKRKHWFAYELGVRKDSGGAFQFGSAVHEGLDQLKRGADVDTAVQATMAVFNVTENPDDALPMTQAAVLVRYWQTRWASESLGILASEQAFNIHMPRNGKRVRQWRLRGKIDGIVTLPDGRLAILEHKTSSQISDAYWQRLELDEQITVYTIAARALGYNVQTVLYDVIRKPSINPRKGELLQGYGVRLAEDVSSRPDFYYFRREVARLDDTLTEGINTLNAVARDINHARLTGHWYRNSNACRSPYPCPYLGVCSSGIDLSKEIPPGFHKTKCVHPELEEQNDDGTTAATSGNNTNTTGRKTKVEHGQTELAYGQ